MRDRGVLPSAVARATGTTPGAVTGWLKGDTCPSLVNLDKLAKLFNVDVSDLLSSTKKEKQDLPAIDAIDALKIIARELGHEIRRRPVRKPADEMPEK